MRARVIAEADDEVTERPVAERVGDHRPARLLPVYAGQQASQFVAARGRQQQQEAGRDARLGHLALLAREPIDQRRPSPHGPLLEQLPQAQLNPARLGPPQLLRERVLRPAWHLRLDKQDSPHRARLVARRADEARRARVEDLLDCAGGGLEAERARRSESGHPERGVESTDVLEQLRQRGPAEDGRREARRRRKLFPRLRELEVPNTSDCGRHHDEHSA